MPLTSVRSILRVLTSRAFIMPLAAPAFAQNWSFDARRIALGGIGTTENVASRTVQEERGYRAIVLPFGLLQILPDMDVFNPTGDAFNPVCAIEHASSPLHYTIGRKPCNRSQPGPAFVNDIVNGRLSRDLNDYRGFRPESSLVAEGLANPSWGKTFALRRDSRGSLAHGIYVGAGPYLSVRSESRIDPALIDILANPSPLYQGNSRFSGGVNAASQMALAITGGYRGRLALTNGGNDNDGLYVAANYHHLRGFRFDRFNLDAQFDTDAAGLLAIRPTTVPVTIDRLKSESGSGFALDLGVAVLMREWTFGFGASGIANRIEWNALERQQFVLDSLFSGGDFLETDLPAPTLSQRITLPVNYTANFGHFSERWSAESEFSHGLQGSNFHGGFEYRLGAVDLRGGGRYARNRWHPSGGAGLNLSRRLAIDIGAFGTSANIERRRDLAIAVSMRINP
jgi:hypothetical protein